MASKEGATTVDNQQASSDSREKGPQGRYVKVQIFLIQFNSI